MTSPVPRWAIAVMAAVFVIVVPAGLAVERTEWAATHPFSLNLLSSVAGFSASAILAALIFNRLARRRYWSAELDARTTTAREVGFLLRDVLSIFGHTTASDSSVATLRRLLDEAASPQSVGDLHIRREALDEVRAGLSRLESVPARFSFLDDPDLIYRSGRLARKGAQLLELEQGGALLRDGRVLELLESAIELAEVADDLQAWAYSAPDRRMRRAVADHAFRSDLD